MEIILISGCCIRLSTPKSFDQEVIRKEGMRVHLLIDRNGDLYCAVSSTELATRFNN